MRLFPSRRERALYAELAPLLDHPCVRVECKPVIATGDHDASCVREVIEQLRRIRIRHGGPRG